MDDNNNLIEYKYYNKSNEEKRTSHKSEFNPEGLAMSHKILNDIFQFFKISLIDISNELTHIDIYEGTIKLILDNKNLKVVYNIYKKKPDYDHEFAILVNEKEIIIDYEKEKNKVIHIKLFDFDSVYGKLKRFIKEEKIN